MFLFKNTQMSYTCVSSQCLSFHCFQFCMSIIHSISSTNDCMPLTLLTSLISPNCHHIPQEKIKLILYSTSLLNHNACTECSNPRQQWCHLMTTFCNAHLSTPITWYSVFPLLARADKVPEVQYPHGLITD